ncbi:XRE family transcriptional regulator [Pseudomonas sp. NPDC086581]|uniref:XRE family transcriptional regulator n=1 Tax=Pseudomonas sp. NPDC086581 TaxID=3364432 RepID=UPI0037F9DD3F
MTKLGDRLKGFRKALHLKQHEVAALCGWDKSGQSRYGQYERGEREPSLADIEKLAAVLQVPLAILVDPAIDAYEPGDSVSIPPFVENGPRANLGRDEIAALGVVVSNLRTTLCTDSGMESSIRQGDKVVIDVSQTTPENLAVYAIHYDGRVIFRRLQRTVSGKWILRCDNTDKMIFPDESLTDADFAAIDFAGRAIWRVGTL